MLRVLLESRAARARRTGGMLLSVTLHAALLCGAVALTADARDHDPPPTPRTVIGILPWTPPQPTGVERPGRTAASQSSTPVHRVVLDGARPIVLGEIEPTITPFGIPDRFAGTENVEWCKRPADCRVGPGRQGGTGADSGTERVAVTEVIARIRGDVPRPRYPESLRLSGITGRVVVQFTVDTAGAVEPGTVRVLESVHDQFSRAVIEVLPRFRFVPAEVNGRRVRMLAQMPFEFTLDRR